MKLILITAWLAGCILIVSSGPTKGNKVKSSDAGGGDGKTGGMGVPKIEETLFTKYKDQVCNAVPTFKGQPSKNVTFYDVMSEDEVYELAFINLAYGLTTDAISHLPVEMGYKKRVIDLISVITKLSCDSDVVPEMYLNAAKNLFLYYVYKHDQVPSPTGAKKNETYIKETWNELILLLEQCAEHVDPIPIMQECDVAAFISLPDGDIPIAIAEERLDIERGNEGHEFVDEIIDAVWWMFSTAYARCYTMYYPREEWVVQFFSAFTTEFIDPFMFRWRDPGPMAEFFPIIFGPFDFRRARANLRACNGASYQIEGIPERQLVRPLLVTVDGVTVLNFKTGISETRKRK